VGYLVNMTIPRSGEVARALVLKNYKDIPFDKAFGTIISERIVDLILLVLFITGTVILQFDMLREYLLSNIPIEKLIFYGVLAAIFFYRINTIVYIFKIVYNSKDQNTRFRPG
jgi:hypothetical protein